MKVRRRYRLLRGGCVQRQTRDAQARRDFRSWPRKWEHSSRLSTMSSFRWVSCIRRNGLLASCSRPFARRQTLSVLPNRSESTATPEDQKFHLHTKKESVFSPFMLLVGLVPIFTFALGTWQVERLKWKVNLIDELQEKLEREPIPLPREVKCVSPSSLLSYSISNLFGGQSLAAIPDFSYRKVILRGTWDHKHAILLGPRVYNGQNGYHLVEPLIRQDGSTVLVDRGFISKERADVVNDLKENSEVEVLGMLRTGQVRNKFTPDNLPEQGTWYWADIDAMAKHAGGGEAGVQPVYIEAIFGKSRVFIPYVLSGLMARRRSRWRSNISYSARRTSR